jgi:hypothetical protein
MPRTSDRKSLFWSKWFWIPLVIGAAFVASADAATYLIQFPALDRARLPGVLDHLGFAGDVVVIHDDEELEAGNAEWKQGHAEAAIREWSKVVKSYGRSENSIPALLNIGWVASHKGDRTAAIRAFAQVIDVPLVLPRRPKRFSSDYDRMALYKHQACIELSDLFLEIRAPRSALKYAELARDTYDFHPSCFVGDDSFSLDDRINAIKSSLAGGQPVSARPRSAHQAIEPSERQRRPPPANPVGRVR